jgi:predicted class III extradiol MEMO1 family dioxygenase
MRIRGNEKGLSMITLLLWFVILFVVIHTAVKIVPMYIDYSRMKDEMAVKASVAQVLKDEEITTDLVKKARELEIPLAAENFKLQRDDEHHLMTISTLWDVEVHFLFDVYVRSFHFEPIVSEDTARVRK